MFHQHIGLAYIADGFTDDCDELIHRCLEAGTVTFEVFSEVWKSMEFACIFHNRSSGAEIAELSEEVIHIAKSYMLADTSNFEESVTGLFLVYSLLNLQPYANFAHLRIVQDDLPALQRIEVVARRDRRQDVLYILGSVLIQGPVQYQAVLRERGMEYPIRKYLEGYGGKDKKDSRPKGVFYRQNTELDLLKELKHLTIRYCNAKENITGVKPEDLSYVDPDFAVSLDKSLRNVISGIYDNDEQDVEEAQEADPVPCTELAKSIKKKAMEAKVKPLRHRMDVASRANQQPAPVNKPPNPKTYTNPRSKAKKRVRKASNSDESEDYTIRHDSDKEGDNDPLDLTNFTQPTSQASDLEIEMLPDIIQNEDQRRTYEIEIIDNFNQASQSSVSTDDSNQEVFKHKRDLKKTIVKSRFKRMGMLPVANFENKDP
ncbi:snRNA-activating protein complex subunit 1-like [Spodoptera frugiperda]|uniref:snRNA-activating protein complex subunit 1-like n=1 Tax=Spodoptera frugiperda TaxID=7108 RepID=A0A9R0DRT4_SPOFR|nr:snRNA-activating protein complex subunit 1-like [Spodoptera frugiperda]XP_050552222.1 snRNA-activating protein complex subunit 1-like [Spodoptera frugiperda]